MVVVFFVFRMRFYAAWCGAEATCISAGLGCYPEKSLSKPGGGPTVNYRYIKTKAGKYFHRRDTSVIAHPGRLFCENQIFVFYLLFWFLRFPLPCCQSWPHRRGDVRLQNHSEHWLLQHGLLCEGATRHALLEHVSAVVATSLHLPQLPLQVLHSEVRLYVCAAVSTRFNTQAQVKCGIFFSIVTSRLFLTSSH